MDHISTVRDALLRLRGELQDKIDAINKLLSPIEGRGLPGAVKQTRTKVKRAYAKRKSKSPKGGGKRRAKKADAETDPEGPKRRNCPRCHQSKLYEAGRKGTSMCAECEAKRDTQRATLLKD